MKKPIEPPETCPTIDRSIILFSKVIDNSINDIIKSYKFEAEEIRRTNIKLRKYAHDLEEYYENEIARLNEIIASLINR